MQLALPGLELRVCTICGEAKPSDGFYMRSHGTPRADCKACCVERSRQWKATKRTALQKAHHDAKNREWHKRYYQMRQDELRAKSLRYYRENPEKRRDSSRRSRHKNPEPSRRAMRRYQQSRKGAPMDAAATAWWENTLRYDPCCYCGNYPPQKSMDHITALNAGGDSAWDNLTMACLPCNAAKQDDSLLWFLLREVTRG